MNIVPLQALPNQQCGVSLGGQDCKLAVYQLGAALYVDIVADGRTIVTCAVARNRTRLVRHPYLGFAGDLAFADLAGDQDPTYDGLGLDGRYQLVYLP